MGIVVLSMARWPRGLDKIKMIRNYFKYTYIYKKNKKKLLLKKRATFRNNSQQEYVAKKTFKTVERRCYLNFNLEQILNFSTIIVTQGH